MDLQTKLGILADAAKYDASCASSGSVRKGAPGGLGSSDGNGICHSYTPDGRCVSLLKILLTNFCVYDCLFCVNRISSDIERARFTPEEVVNLTLDFYRRNYIEGLFLSSGIFSSPDVTMEQMVKIARSLREDHAFGGYIHLKVIPGAAPELIAEAGRFADRLSANIELPTDSDLSALAPEKTMAQIGGSMDEIAQRVDEVRHDRSRTPLRFAPAGQTTQMIVGATPSTDRQILATADGLYRQYGLRRIYYSAFSPFPRGDHRLPQASPPLMREHRLYQADWLMRKYGFGVEELTTPESPELALDGDPKLSWARRNPGFFPIDVNTAPREALLRVPGIGFRNAQRIVDVRRHTRLEIGHLRKLRVVVDRAKAFLVTADHHPSVAILQRQPEPSSAVQMALFSPDGSAVTGEL